jgi:hypothetical protein
MVLFLKLNWSKGLQDEPGARNGTTWEQIRYKSFSEGFSLPYSLVKKSGTSA